MGLLWYIKILRKLHDQRDQKKRPLPLWNSFFQRWMEAPNERSQLKERRSKESFSLEIRHVSCLFFFPCPHLKKGRIFFFVVGVSETTLNLNELQPTIRE